MFHKKLLEKSDSEGLRAERGKPANASRPKMTRRRTRRAASLKAVAVFFSAALAAISITTLGASCDKGGLSRKADRPNVILISIDTLRADHLHGYGYGPETSPALDRLMRRGTSFSTAITSAPWTLPSHVSLITSLYPHSHGVISEPLALNESVQTLPMLFKKAGYNTAGFATMPHLSPRHGFGRGFDLYRCEEVRAPIVLDKVLKWLETGDREDFFIFLHLFDVHSDYNPSERFLKMFESSYEGDIDGTGKTLYAIRDGEINPSEEDMRHLIALYDAEIRQLDNNLDMFFGALEERGLLEDTIIIVTSDHGEEFLDHGGVLHGQTLYDELIRIPLIMAGPGVPKDKLVKKQVQAIDIMPTILELCGVRTPAEAQGRSMAPLLRDEKTEWTEQAFVEADWRNEKHDIKRALRTDRYKLYYDRHTGREELYDLAKDPGEKLNIIDSQPKIAEPLRRELKKWMAAERGKPVRIKLTEEEKSRLKALGYLN
jgi:arylsulfatase A-like enzyme